MLIYAGNKLISDEPTMTICEKHGEQLCALKSKGKNIVELICAICKEEQ